ncbi:MAG: ComEC/Rec2 family competence protein [Clostridia bacterium]|nr:ComEC/Rec2 family competence protein [Clostridia bacterium]
MILISALALISSMLISHVYFDLWFYADKRFDGEVSVSGTVVEISSQSSYSGSYIIKTDSIGGEPLTNYKLSALIDLDTASGITVGTKISFKCTLTDFNYLDKNYKIYRYAKGISASCDDIKDFVVLGNGEIPIESYFSHMRENISRHAIMQSDYETGSFVSALLLGERELLSDQLNLDFKRIGITHMLALSGMHLAILSAGLERLLRAFRCPKNARVVTTIVFCVLYMALTGFPSSILRAGYMLILSSVLFLFSREQDPITSLFVSVSIICFTTPYAIYDLSLWLSAFATLGVIVYSDYRDKTYEKRPLLRVLKDIGASILVSVFAIIATLGLTITAFNGISTISPISTTLFTIPIEIVMYLGMLMLILGNIVPIGIILRPVVQFVTAMAGELSSLDVYVSNKHPLFIIFAYILIACFFLFIILDIKKKKRAVATLTGMLCFLFILASVLNKTYAESDRIAYSGEEKQDMILIESEHESCLINSSQYSKSNAYDNIAYIEKHDRYKLDKYIITHYSYKAYEHLSVLLSSIPIQEIYLPTPKNEEERSIYDRIIKLEDKFRTKIIIHVDNGVTVGGFNIVTAYHEPYGEGSARCALYFYDHKKTYAYISSGMLDKDTRVLTKEIITQSDGVIFGSHGKKYKSGIYLEAELYWAEYIIINSENLFLTQEDYISYEKNGCKIYSHPNYVEFKIKR